MRVLAQFPDYVAWRNAEAADDAEPSIAAGTETPRERIDAAYRALRKDVEDELLELVLKPLSCRVPFFGSDRGARPRASPSSGHHGINCLMVLSCNVDLKSAHGSRE